MIVATSPGRCGLIGNPTDMYGGSVISCSTSERATCTLEQDTQDISITVSGEQQVMRKIEDFDLKEDDRLNVARGVLSALEVVPGQTRPFHLEAVTEIPMQAGLAGSTAILATIVGCVLAHLEIRLSPYETAELIRKIEYDVLHIVCGFQDHYMATFGGLNYMDFRGKNNAQPQGPDSPLATIEPLDKYMNTPPLILAHTGVKHHSGTVHRTIRDRWAAGETAVIDGNTEIARIARLGKRALMTGDLEILGELMNRNHAIQRDLGGSGEANETLIKAARNAGALGAKLAGAGGGGTIIALSDDVQGMGDALMAAGADRIMYPVASPGLTVSIRC